MNTHGSLEGRQNFFSDSPARFLHPRGKDGGPLHYFCGNSLGLQPIASKSAIEEVLADWAGMAVEGHFRAGRRWYDYPSLLSPALAALCGADSTEVRAMGTLTANLHLMMVSFFRPSGKRTKILMESGAFPSDQYAVETQLRFHGLDPEDHLIELSPRPGESWLHTEDILSAIEKHAEELSLVLFSGVQYLSGQVFDMSAIAAAAKKAGACVGFDLAHAIGNVPLRLHDWQVDFAVWCSYKYLNGGPGAVAGIFVHKEHAENNQLPRFAGWYGYDEQQRFLMEKGFKPAYGAQGWQLSNENILSMASLRAALEEFQRVDFNLLMARQKELVARMEEILLGFPDIQILTPISRGGQLSMRLRNGNTRMLLEHLRREDIVGDYREPGVVRLAVAPLYNSETDLAALESALASFSSTEIK
jgi:kynureninase